MLLFILVCIPLRILIALSIQKLPIKYNKYASIPILLMGVAFLILYFGNMRLNAPEAGGKTWWASFRIIHGLLYTSSGLLLLLDRNNIASIPLFIDIIVGLLAFTNHHLL
jgi:hypothetical protein